MKPQHTRADFAHFYALNSRWADNDIYGHVNNVTYYAYFDTAVNQFLIGAGLDIHGGDSIAFVVNSQCQYLQPLCFPDVIDIGLSVLKLGSSSVTYELGVFRQGDDSLCALGQFVHVFVDRAHQRPTPVPPALRAALSKLCRA